MKISDVAKLRLASQQISRHQFKTAADLVTGMGGMQAQDYPGVKWAIGLRLPKATEDVVEKAVADAAIVRSWVFRGTLHLVAPEDLRWMISLTAERQFHKADKRHADLKLDAATFKRSQSIFQRALEGGYLLTREELYKELERKGISTQGQRGYHMLWAAGLNRLICFGPLKGKQPTFALLDDWIPKSKELKGEQALAELALRYFQSHGPARVADLAWWAGLTLAEARSGHQAAKGKLAEAKVDDESFWMAGEIAEGKTPQSDVFVLPGFDEYVIGYKDRKFIIDDQLDALLVPYKNGMFQPTIVSRGRIIGTWKCTTKKEKVLIEISPFSPLTKSESKNVSDAANRFGTFLDLETVVSI